MYNRNSTGKRCISCALSHSVHRKVYALNTGFYCLQYICCSKVVVVMPMEIKMNAWIAGDDLSDEISHFLRLENTQRIGQHNSFNRLCCQKIQVLKNIFRRIPHAVAPIFQVNITFDSFLLCLRKNSRYFCKMLFRCFLQLVLQVIEGALCKQVHDLGSGLRHPVYGNLTIYKGEDFNFL